MLDFSATRLTRFSASWVGNKNRYEGVVIPKQTMIALNDVAEELILTSMLKSFEKTEEFFYFHHEEDVSNHPIFRVCATV